jgi:endonuclease YncB( thermonuclease family)
MAKPFHAKLTGRMAEDMMQFRFINVDNVEPFTLDGTKTVAMCSKVYDGDTIHLIIPINGDFKRIICRMQGYNSAEIKGSGEEERKKAIAARDRMSELVYAKVVYVELGKNDKYGRVLTNVFLIDGRDTVGECVNDIMMREGHGAPYNGKGEKKF